MKKRYFAAIALCASLLVSSLCFTVSAEDIDIDNPNTIGSEMTLGVNHVGATNHPYQYGLAKMAQLLSEYSDGAIGLTIYPASQIASGAKAIEFVQMGTLDMCLDSTMALENFVPEDGVLNMPFIFSTKEEVYSTLDGPVGDELKANAEAKGLKILCWMDNGFRDISNSIRPITEPEDLKGIKLRTPESSVFVDTFTELGATPTAMAVSEVFSAMQLGICDGQENPSSNFVNNKYGEVNKYYSVTHHIYTAEPLMMSMDKWNSLTEEQQEILQKAADEACQYEREQSDAVDEENMKAIADMGVEINELSPEAIQAFKDAVQPIYEKYESEYGEMIKKLQDAAAEVTG